MRVLQVFEPAEGGVRAHVEEVVRGLVRRGHEVDVAISRDPAARDAFERLGARPLPMDLVPSITAHATNARAFGQLARAMRTGRYDVAHLHDAKAGAVGRPAAALTRTPVVYSPHNFVYLSQHLRERRGSAARRALTLAIERGLAPLTDAFVCVSEHELAAATADRIGNAARFRVIHHGLPGGQAVEPDPELARLAGEAPLVGFLGRLQEGKGIPQLLAAFAELRRSGIEARLAIVGNGPLHEPVRAQIAERGLGAEVALRAFEGDPARYLGAFDLLAVPSLWEALPIVVLEGMAAGLPVVASRVGGIPEAVEDGVTGVLVPPGDTDALAAALGNLLRDGELRGRLGASARDRCAERFSASRMVGALEELYLTVAHARRPR